MKKLLFIVAIAAMMASCSTHRATVISTSAPTPMKTTTTVAHLDVGKTRISYTYVPTRTDSKRLSEAQLIDNAIYMALQENGNADVLVKVNYFVTKRNGFFSRRIKSISLSGYPARYVNFHQPTEADYENFTRLPQGEPDALAKNNFLNRIFHKKHHKNPKKHHVE